MYLRAKAIEHLIVDFDELIKQLCSSPWVFWIIPRGKPSLGEIDADPFGACFEALANVFLAFVDQIFDKLVFGVAFYFVSERVK